MQNTCVWMYSLFNDTFSLLLLQMNVLLVVTTVNRTVRILLVPTHVHATVDIHWLLMGSHASQMLRTLMLVYVEEY